MDKSPFNSPSPQDSPRLCSFTQHHRPVIAVHSGEREAGRGLGGGQGQSAHTGAGRGRGQGRALGPRPALTAPPRRHRPESTPVLRPALPHHVHSAADSVHLLPAKGHPLPAASQPSGPAQRSHVACLRPGQPAAWSGPGLKHARLPLPRPRLPRSR
nr:uncharacterized protein LOC108176151 [Oryctolagus cuniculus]